LSIFIFIFLHTFFISKIYSLFLLKSYFYCNIEMFDKFIYSLNQNFSCLYAYGFSERARLNLFTLYKLVDEHISAETMLDLTLFYLVIDYYNNYIKRENEGRNSNLTGSSMHNLININNPMQSIEVKEPTIRKVETDLTIINKGSNSFEQEQKR